MKALLSRINQYLLFTVLITVVFYYGRPLLVPLFFAILFSMLMTPVCRFLEKRKWPRALSCTTSILILVVVIAGLMAIIIGQIAAFAQDMKLIEEKATAIWTPLQEKIETRLHISPARQDSLISEQAKGLAGSPGASLGSLAGSLTSMLAGTAITLVFTFLLLYGRENYEKFFLRIFKNRDEEDTKEVLHNIAKVSQQYLTGRVFSMIFLFVLYAISLSIIGIRNALLLSAIASVLTIVPYLGAILGGLIPVLAALVTEDSMQPAVWTAIVIILIQAADNYFIEPLVIGGEVRLSALATIASIFIGGLLWGTAGMVLFIPLFSIAKIIFEHTPGLDPYAKLIGSQGESPSAKIKKWFGG